MMKQIPKGSKGEGLRKLKAKAPQVTKKMGYAKQGKYVAAKDGKFMCSPRKMMAGAYKV